MEESFLHFIWKFQQFNQREIFSDEGQQITVLSPGQHNKDSGPDFFNAKVRIGTITWNGNVEIHINAKDWKRHNHQKDPAYENVVLHVVWNNDAAISRKDKTQIPTLEIKGLVDEMLLLNYKKLFSPWRDILCEAVLNKTDPITLLNMKDKALIQRLEAKSENIFRKLALTNGDWEEITWRMLCENFGFKTNSHSFAVLGKSIPFSILKKESYQLNVVEALMFGMAGFLDDALNDPYYEGLRKEFLFKQNKYGLERQLDKHQWKFLRLRPANFPTIRISQLASLVARKSRLFSFCVDFNSVKSLKNGLAVEQSSYWKKHYKFGKQAKSTIGVLGQSSIENIIINTVAPLLFAYSIHKDNQYYKDKSLDLLAEIKSEKNFITKKWDELGLEINNAFDSQALIELYNEFCKKKRCLDCSIGAELVGKR